MDRKVSNQRPNGKGKARDDFDGASDPKADQATPQDRIPDHLLSRIANSASTLSGTLFSGPPSNDVLSSIAGAEKGQSSSLQPAIADPGKTSGSSQIRVGQPAALPSLRTTATEDHVAREEAAFASFLDSTESFVPSERSDTEKAWESAGPVPESRGQRSQTSGSLSGVEAQEAVDGQELVDFLGKNEEESPDFTDHEKFSQQDVANLRKALFGDEDGSDHGHLPPGWDNLLNFIPQYLYLGESGRYQANVLSNSMRAEESSMHLGTSDLGEGWQQWIDQWSSVLTNYQDEVWGDLGSLVQEARAEVEQLAKIEPSEPPPQPKALLRLRNILGHLRG